MKGFGMYSKYDLAERLSIRLPRTRPIQKEGGACRKPRSVTLFNADGTTTVYPSISKASKALKVSTTQLYIKGANGTVKIE